MIIQCSACQTRFKLADEKLKPQGVKVRCTRCNEVFLVTPPATEEPVAPPEPPSAPLQEPAASTPEDQDSAAEDFDFGEFNMEDLDAAAGGTSAVGASAAADDFALPDLSAPTPDQQDTDAHEAPPGELPPLEDFNLDEDEFGGFDSEGDENLAIGGDLGETFEVESFGDKLPELDDAFMDSPQELSFDDRPAEDFGAEPDEADGGPREFAMTDEQLNSSALYPDDHHGSGAADEFVFEEEPPSRNDDDFSDIGFDAPEPLPNSAPAAPATASAAPAAAAPVAAKTAKAVKPASRPARSKGPQTKRRKKKSHRRGPLLFILFVLLLGAGYGYFGWSQGGVYHPAPLIERALSLLQIQTKPDQIGLIEIRNLRNQFVVNQNAGQLFVVHGQAVNRFNGARSSLLVRGLIYDKAGNVVLQQTAFCGNPLDVAALRTLPYSKIEESMNNQFGEALSNLNLAPDQAIPFTIVFRNLPPEIAQFNVEVADSRPGTK